MSIEIRPVGTACNLKCKYCYETCMRDQTPPKLDMATIARIVPKMDRPFSLFGGEAMLLPMKDLEALLKLAFDKWNHSGIQTNGSLIRHKHIELFKKYKTCVGISVDGPDELNDARWAGTEESTREFTRRTHEAIRMLSEAGMPPSIIITLHAGNCSKDRFPRLIKWFHELEALGVTHLNPHFMEMDAHAGELFLPDNEIIDRLIELWHEEFTTLKITLFDEILKLLQGDDHVVCCWKGCDPWNTTAVHGIEADGSPSHCSRTNKDNINWLPAEGSGQNSWNSKFSDFPSQVSHERQLALYVTPQGLGGCNGCPYWLLCTGHCPGTGMDGDWRKRTTHCAFIKQLFNEGIRILHARGVDITFPERPDRLQIEQAMYREWVMGKSTSLTHFTKAKKDCAPNPAKPGTNDHLDNGFYTNHKDHLDYGA